MNTKQRNRKLIRGSLNIDSMQQELAILAGILARRIQESCRVVHETFSFRIRSEDGIQGGNWVIQKNEEYGGTVFIACNTVDLVPDSGGCVFKYWRKHDLSTGHQGDFHSIQFAWENLDILVDGLLEKFPEIRPGLAAVFNAAEVDLWTTKEAKGFFRWIIDWWMETLEDMKTARK